MPCEHGFLPQTFEPIYKEKIWGGHSLKTKLNKNIPDNRLIGESWEISGVCGYESKARLGADTGTLLSDIILREGRTLVGPRCSPDFFPLLYKFIDAQHDLSIQLHPDDMQARRLGLGDNGKTECWYIVDALPQARVICGLKRGVTRDDIREALNANQLPALCNYVPIAPGDVIFVPPGTVHATLAHTLLYEVQQTSDLIFRLYDWKRLDGLGNPRPLHVEQALSAVDLTPPIDHPIEPVILDNSRFYHALRMACRYFAMEEYRWDKPARWDLPIKQSFQAITVMSGSMLLGTKNGEQVYGKGDTVLLPACPGTFPISAEAGTRLIVSYVPDLVSDIIEPLHRLGIPRDSIERLGGVDSARNDLSAALRNFSF
jgi:mannose-6-phosphate isomerase